MMTIPTVTATITMSMSMSPDYSRQLLLKEVGSAGQAKLAASRVLVVGAGGLGSPVLQYLAGAGVGFLSIIDADTLHPSNLHRQPIFALSDAGRQKVALAAAAVEKINPGVRLQTHALRFDADNALALVSAHDVVVDCSDNFRTKFLINDAAVLARRPAVFASVYQYEGQVQVYKPAASHACLRCLWPDATADGVVGNCAEAGVLGPVPGTFGCVQALLTLKILLGIPGQLDGELLLMDFMSFGNTKLKAPRRAECIAPGCALVRELAPEQPDLELTLASLEEARARRLELIDVRTLEEFSARPTPSRHIPMATLLEDPAVLDAGESYLLICASGKRSLAAARELRKRGVDARSLAGGLQALESAGVA
ncbi:MAG TPA: HesA/MoeB/ThiF family protein [Steroidobacteraceae bacterium]|nr:HesA/MoeB/ThiF family protein [Steroidobacteraceae bacterium]